MRISFFFLVCIIGLTGCTIAPISQPMTRSSDLSSVQLSDGQKLYYRVAGQEHADTPLLLIHGIPDASDTWNVIAKELGRTHRVYAVDLAGYGYSDRAEGYDVSLSAQADYLVELLDKLRVDRAVTTLSKEIRAVPAPTLILWAREDKYLDPEPAKELCRNLRSCHFVFIEHAGHFVLDEQPQVVANAIEQFVLTKQ